MRQYRLIPAADRDYVVVVVNGKPVTKVPRCPLKFPEAPMRMATIDLPALGITYRQLTYWTGQAYIFPEGHERPGSGHAREWSDAELRIAVLMGKLTRAGLRAGVAAKVARDLEDQGWAYLAADILLTVDNLTRPAAG